MLPSNPRAGRSRSAVRQPAASQPRSSSRPRERRAGYEDRGTRGQSQDGGHARQVHSQRSMGSISSSRRRELAAPPMPAFRRFEDDSRSVRSSPATYTRSPPPRNSESSDSSVSSPGSSGSSFLDRMRNRGAPNSSQSSFELDLDTSKETLGVDRDSRKPGVIHDEQSFAANDIVSYGYSIWNRVATAASTWSSWTGTSNGSITGVAPSSEDSEITRALKAYHISKARDRSDLPDWLFDERERRVDTQKPTHRARNDDQNYIEDTQRVTGARGRGFRDIYDSVATSAPESRPRERFDASGRSALASDPLERSNTRVADRLKAIRDAKRLAAGVEQGDIPALPNAARVRVDRGDTRHEDRLSSRRGEVFREPTERNTPGRVGLPTNPRRR